MIFLDTETTGLKADIDKIVEVAILDNGAIYNWYINPEKEEMDEEAYNVHKLSLEFLKQFPTFKEIAEEIFIKLKGQTVIAHNSPFDEAFIKKEFEDVGITTEDLNLTWIDSKKISEKVFGERKSLDELCSIYNIDRENRDNRHSATLDVKLLEEVFICLKRDLKEKENNKKIEF